MNMPGFIIVNPLNPTGRYKRPILPLHIPERPL